jgi:hypothetical protein
MQITIQTERRSSSEVPPIITLHQSVPHLFVLFLISPVCANTIILINPHKFIIPHLQIIMCSIFLTHTLSLLHPLVFTRPNYTSYLPPKSPDHNCNDNVDDSCLKIVIIITIRTTAIIIEEVIPIPLLFLILLTSPLIDPWSKVDRIPPERNLQ